MGWTRAICGQEGCLLDVIALRTFNRIIHLLDPETVLLRAWPLSGGISAVTTALTVARSDGSRQDYVVRQHHQLTPHAAEAEYRLLQQLYSLGMPVPQPYFFDSGGTVSREPYLVLEFIDGEPIYQPEDVHTFIRQAAAHLAQIHRVSRQSVDLSYLRSQMQSDADFLLRHFATPLQMNAEAPIRQVLEAAWPLPPVSDHPLLLHGDFWPGNLLWRGGQMVAVIDWEDASLGNPLADLANSRLEILWACGIECMHAFTRHYQALMPGLDFQHLAHWDLVVALRTGTRISAWAVNAAAERSMFAGHTQFVEQAFNALA
ncbi:MAG: phosphotransferase family protein [Chloroflexota bacterium]